MSPLSQSLASLAQQHKLAGTLASVVRAEMPAIEAARLAGLSFAQICQGLEALGISASARTLRHTVYRIQAEQRRKAPAEGRAPEGPDKSARMPARAAPSVSTAPAKGDESKPKVAPMVQAEVQAMTKEPVASPTGPIPGFVRNIINTPVDMEELARQYRNTATRRAAASSAQAPPARAGSQGALPL